MKSVFSRFRVATLFAALAVAPALQTGADESQEALLRQALELGGQEVAPEELTVETWVKQPLAAERVVQIGGQFFVMEKETGRVYAGWSEGPGRVEVGGWSTPESLLAQLELPPLPEAPAGFAIRSVMVTREQGVRVAGDPTGRWLYVLGRDGLVERHDTQTGRTEVFADPRVYSVFPDFAVVGQGLTFDDAGRMYLVANSPDTTTALHTHRVVIYRSEPVTHGGAAPTLLPWLRASYPWGGHQFGHGVGHVAQGPDGLLYVGSGSRTDANEDFPEPHLADGGEVELTACLWRLDPASDTPEIEIVTRGLRNPFGFTWDPQGRMWATDNGPNMDPPGELNVVEFGEHYGFPYRFSDWPENPYEHVPEPPADLSFRLPVLNIGPDAGGSPEQPIATFDAHSSPNGIAYLGDAFPDPVRGALAVVRFGNQIGTSAVGYDLLLVRPGPAPDANGRWRASVHEWVTGLARPLDVYAAPNGRLYILEHARHTKGKRGWAGERAAGRLLELRPAD